MRILGVGAPLVLTVFLTTSGLLAQQGPGPVITVPGQIRLRGEWDGRTGGTGDDAAVLSRIRVGLATRVEPWLSAFVQLQDARAWGTEADPTEGTADQFDLHQGYLDLTKGPTTLRIGRQEVGLGDERLVGPLAWANTGRSFDGALVRRELPGGHLRAFWMTVMERDALTPTGVHPQQNEGDDADGWLLGAFFTRQVGPGPLELMLLHDRNAATDESWTAHGRLHGARGRLLFDASAAYQFGPDRGAYLFSALLGAAVGTGGRVAAQLDYISGDDDPLDAERKAFHTLYPTAHAYHGYMDYFLTFPAHTAAAGLIDAVARITVPVPAPWTLRGDLHHFSLAEDRLGDRSLGIETDIVVGRTLAPGATIEGGASLFVPENAMGVVAPAFALGTDTATYWGYLMFTVSW